VKVYYIPEKVSALIFDMDNTLYTHDEYLRLQLESPVRRLAEERGVSFETMREAIEARRQKYAEENNGVTLSLGSVFKSFGVSIEETVRWREELYMPEKFLREDRKLRKALLSLAARFQRLKELFETGKTFKPSACCPGSFETYYVGLGRK
jgi:phosphoglycolate phosphatase/putative hydrolase of the HAD superfamily